MNVVFLSASLLQKSKTGRACVQQELKDREEVERGLSLVKSWIQDSRELLLNPTADMDILTQELEVIHQAQISQYTFSGTHFGRTV